MATVLILLGAPGAGKGTQAVRLSAALSLPHVSTGDLFREHLKHGTEFGKKAKAHMDSGRLVPDDVVLDMLFERVAQDDCGDGYVLDGFPRTLPQAEALEARLQPATELTVLDLEVPDDDIVGRIGGRLLCGDCGAIYHRTFAPPNKDGVCDACGGELYQRKDDSADVVRERLRVYHEQTSPLVRYYEERSVLHRVDGTRSPDAVHEALLREIERVSERG